MSQAIVSQAQVLRSFGRKFTKVMGLLNETPYDASLGLLDSRIIFEIAGTKNLRAADLVHSLSVDKGYLSRTLARLKKSRLIQTEPCERDRREQLLRLTPKGQALFAQIDRASTARAQTLLKSLGPNAGAFSEHIALANAALARESFRAQDFELRGLKPGDLGWVIGRHGELYAREFGWNKDFEALVAQIALKFVKKQNPARERAWIAELNGARLGCVFLVRESATTAKLRILLVDPAARGLGLGARLVRECVAFARRAGYSEITLWTNDVLVVARRIYEAEGFKLVREEAHESFGQKLNGQFWSKDLTHVERSLLQGRTVSP